jgi:imidazoleglycerol phosphate synthase glutamine amidotransferase subunit HisH
LDYTAGVLPITKVDAIRDTLPKSFKPTNAIEAEQYAMYNASAMHGLPVGVQVVGKRLEEEKVLEGMKIIEGLLKKERKGYELIPF